MSNFQEYKFATWDGTYVIDPIPGIIDLDLVVSAQRDSQTIMLNTSLSDTTSPGLPGYGPTIDPVTGDIIPSNANQVAAAISQNNLAASNSTTSYSNNYTKVELANGESVIIERSLTDFIGDLAKVPGSAETAFNFEKTICVPIPTSTEYPNSAINWFYQNSSFGKWTPTALNSILRKKDMLGLKDVNIKIFVSAMSLDNNQVAWQLKLVDPSNSANSINLLTSSDAGANNIITIGGFYGSFGPGWTEYSKDFTVAGANDLDTLFFHAFNATEGQLELHIANNGNSGSIITGCTTRFLSLC